MRVIAENLSPESTSVEKVCKPHWVCHSFFLSIEVFIRDFIFYDQ